MLKSAFRRRLSFVAIAALCAPVGCAKYEARPLTSQAVQKQLAAPDDHTLSASVNQLHHPRLHAVAIDPARGFSPDEAALVAVIINPDLRAERDQRGIAAAQLLQAGLLPNPQLSGALDFPYDSSPPDNFTAYNLGLNWEVTALLSRDAKRRAASAQGAAVELDIAWKEWQIAQAARGAAYDVLSLQSQVAFARQADNELRENLRVVKQAVEQHHKTLLELAAAQSAAQDAHAAALALEKDLTRQKLQLNRAMGFAPDHETVVRHEGDLPSRLDPPVQSEFLSHAEERRLDLLALKRGYESQDQTVRAAILAQFPKINLGFAAARDTMAVKTLGFGVAIDIPIFDRNQATIASETATRQKLFDEYASRVFAARSDAATAIADIQSTNAQIAAAQEALPDAENLAQRYQGALQQGNIDALSVYSAQSALAQKRIDLAKLKQQLVQNWIALEIACGQYLPMQASASAEARR